MKHTPVSPQRVSELSYHPLARAVSFALGVMMASAAAPAFAGPEDGQIVEGIGSITQGIDTTLITQGSQTLGIDWQSFNVAEGESVRFDQPTSAAVAINRILDQNPSQIFGAIDANGHVYLLNPNGVVFGATARVDVGSLVASSLNLTRAENGSLEFSADGPAGLVVNRGLIRAATGGSVSLLGGSVANEGLIVADLGKVNLGAGARASLDFDGDGLLFFEVDGDVLTNGSGADAAVSNSGTIQADGGQVLLSARAAQGVFANVVNNTGLIRAARIDNSGGTVRLVGSGAPVIQAGSIDVSAGDGVSSGGTIDVLGDNVNVTASADLRADGATSGGAIRVLAEQTASADGDFYARGGAAGGDGGFIETSGDSVDIGGAFSANASAVNGAPGTWLLDPTNRIIDTTLAAAASAALDGGSNFTISTAAAGPDAGNITMTAPIARTSGVANVTLSLIANNDISVTQDITSTSGTLNVALEAGRNITIDSVIGIPGGTLTATVDTDEGTTNDAATLTIGTAANLSAATITLDGSAAALNDTLQVLRAGGNTAAWTINGSNAGTVSAPLLVSSGFQNFSNLTGGDQTDEFTFTGVAGVIGGTAAGAAGNDLFTVDNGTGAAAFDGGAGASDDLTYAGSAGPVTVAISDLPGIEGVTGSADAGDILEGTTSADTFTTSGANAGAVGGITFSSFENLRGLGGNDTFNLGHSVTTADGGDDNDTFNLTAGVGATVIGGAGGTNSDTVVADSTQATQFSITSSGSAAITHGVGDTVAALGFENLTGSDQADTFTFTVGGAITGTAAGLAGNDDFIVDNGNGAAAGTFDGGANTGAGDELTFAGSAGPVTLSSGAVANMETVTGSPDGEDTLQGTAGADTFTTTATDEIAVGGLTFTSFENVAGLGGNDVFNLDNDLTGTTGANGGANDDTFNLNADVNATIAGGANDDRIVADVAQATDFDITSPGTGTVTNGGGNVAFSGIEGLTGSGQNDDFTFSVTGSLTGSILGLGGNDDVLTNGFIPNFDGGAGTDTINFGPSGAGTPFVIDAADYVGLVENLLGSPNDEDVLQGTSVGDTFTTTAEDQVVFGGVTFSSFENLRGLGGDDTFNLNHNITGTEGANGGANDDTFNLAAGVSATIAGDLGTDRIVAAAAQATQFTIGSLNGGSIQNAAGNLAFTGVENLTGSNVGDTFTFNVGGSLGGTAAGGSGDDDFNVNNGNGASATFDGGAGASDDVSFAGSAGPVTVAVGSFAAIETVTGTAASDTFQGTGGNDTFTTSAANNGTVAGVNFVGFENLQGVAGDDTFNLNHNVTSADGGADNDTFNLATGVSATIAGNSGTDRIAAAATQATQFTIGSANGGSVTNGVGALTFTGVESLTGSNVDDTFTFSGAGSLGGTAAGGSGDDDFLISNGNTAAATIDGGTHTTGDDLSFAGSAGPVTVAVGVGFTGIETVTGTASSDTLQGTSGNDTFATTAANNGSVNGSVNFIGFEALQGLAGDDTFNLDHNVTSADGGADNDVFNFATGITANVTGGTGSDSQRYTGAAGPVTIAVGTLAANSIEDVRGSAANGQDTLQGTGGDDTFTTSATDAGTVAGITFSSFENLQGAAGNDTFNVNHNVTGATGVDGGANDDIVNLGAGVTAVVTGGADSDSLRYATQSGPVTIAVDSVIAAQFENVVGSASGSDVLQGTAGADTFATSAANAGGVAGITFASFENLQGLAGDDTFALDHSLASADGGADNDIFNIDDGGLAVTVLGGAGTDSQRYCCATGPVTVAVGTLTANSIEDVVGSANGQDILQGTGGADTFTTSGADAGTAGSVTFASFENLQGAAGDDVFNLDHNITGTAGVSGGDDNDIFNFATGVTATIAGGAGTDSQRYAGATGPVTIGLGTLAATSIEDVVGSASGEDTLTGTAAAETFTTSGADAGSVAGITFSSVENLQGAGGNDTFNLGHDITGTAGVDGGSENDTFNLSAGVTTTIAGGANTDTIVAANAATGFAITASDAGTVTNGAGTVGFAGVENLTGGAQADTFTFSGTGVLTGTASGQDGADQFVVNNGDTTTILSGGAGSDTLTYAGSAGPVTLVLNVANLIESVLGSASTQDVLRGTTAADTFATASTTSVTAGGVTFSGFETFDGSAGADTFNVGHNLGAGTTLDGGADGDTFNLTATGATALRGGAGADRFVFNDSVVANGVLDGGSEADVLDLRSYTTSRSVTITGPGGVDGVNGTDSSVPGGFQNIDDVQGSTTAADTLRGAGTNSTWTLAGNSGVYATAGRSLAFTSFSTLEGGAAADAFGLGAGTFTGNLVLGDIGGSDTANVTGAINVTGNLTLTNIETVTDTSGARITAGTLRITGATGGVGATNQALQTNVNNLEITGGNNIVVTEQNGLTVSTVNAGTGTVRLTVSAGDLTLGFVQGGNVRLDALDGDILSTTGGTHVQGNPVALVTPFGTSGTEANPIVINAPATGQILIESLDPATISNLNLATVLATRSSVIDVTVNQGIDLGTLGSSISRQEVAAIDWAGLDPNIALVDCLQPCIMLPADQSEEPGLVDLREATKLLLIRTRDGWKLIPVMVRETVVAAR